MSRAAVHPLAPATDSTRARIVMAALEQCQEVGLRRATMEDVARRAGLGRATLYRHFESKDALVQAVILAEAQAFFAALDGALADCADDEERVIEGFAFALGYVRGHALLDKLLRTEPETLFPYLIGSGELIALARDAVWTRLRSRAGRGQRGRETAELVVRLGLSLVLTPQSTLGAEDRAGALALAHRHLVAGLRGS